MKIAISLAENMIRHIIATVDIVFIIITRYFINISFSLWWQLSLADSFEASLFCICWLHSWRLDIDYWLILFNIYIFSWYCIISHYISLHYIITTYATLTLLLLHWHYYFHYITDYYWLHYIEYYID
jgi:hypothetical protein